jgi:hypothetical protein
MLAGGAPDHLYESKALTGQPMLKSSVTNFVHALIAVLAGNLAYFLLMPRLPARAQHVAFRLDLGLLVDFWLCLVAFGIIKTVAGRRTQSKLNKP